VLNPSGTRQKVSFDYPANVKSVMPVLIHQVAVKSGANQLTIDADGVSYGIFKLNI
jgi:hypothetical protein